MNTKENNKHYTSSKLVYVNLKGFIVKSGRAGCLKCSIRTVPHVIPILYTFTNNHKHVHLDVLQLSNQDETCGPIQHTLHLLKIRAEIDRTYPCFFRMNAQVNVCFYFTGLKTYTNEKANIIAQALDKLGVF